MNEFMWWATVLTYWVVVALCFAAFSVERQWRRSWGILTAVFAIFAFNKQHDLSGVVTRFFRRAAVQEHWYGYRRIFQTIVLLGIISVGLTVFFVLEKWARRARWSVHQRSVLGIAIYLFGFATARAVSLHAIDSLLYRDIGGMKLNWVFELGGLLLGGGFIAASIIQWRRAR